MSGSKRFPVAPRLVRGNDYSHFSSSNASDAAVVALQNAQLQQQDKDRRNRSFDTSLQYRLARRHYDRCRGLKDKIPPARPSAMEVSSMGILVLRNRVEYEERGQARQYSSDVRKCAMEMERRRARAVADRIKSRSRKRRLVKVLSPQARAALASQRQAVAVDEQMEAVARKRTKLQNLLECTRKHNLSDALVMVRLERLGKQGLRVPGPCHCRHGANPLSPTYISYCEKECPLYENYPAYRRRVMDILTEMCKDAQTLDAKVLSRTYHSRKCPFEDPLVVQKREQIWQRSKGHEKSRFLKALQLVRLERMHRGGLDLPPLCNCDHGSYPLDPAYIKHCRPGCPVSDSLAEYKRRLLPVLEFVLDKVRGHKEARPITINVTWKKRR